MAKFADKCQQCGKDFENYDEPRAYRRFCSVGCNADWVMDRDEALKEGAPGAIPGGGERA